MADWEKTITRRPIEVTMMKWRWLAIAGVLGVVACMTLLVLGLMPAGPGVTKANFDRIQAGMSRTEVEDFFGRPADTKTLHGGRKIRHTVEGWQGDGGNAAITSDEARGVVAEKEWFPRDESILQRVRRWLRLS
jgi:hypothetical protein